MAITPSDKILVSCISAAFLFIIWKALPGQSPELKSKKGFVSSGRALQFFRPAVSVAILFVNILVWMIK